MKDQKNKVQRASLAFKGEQKVLTFLGEHLYVIALVVITGLAIVARSAVMDYQSGDAYYFLLPWYDQIKPLGFNALSQQIGDYNILYQFLVAIFTYLPFKALHAYKLFSIIFDFLLAALGARIIYKNAASHPQLKSVLMYGCILFSPLVFFNSAVWAQCDVIYTYFCVFSLYEMYKDKYLASVILFGVALTFKLQAIFILPILLFCYFVKKRFSFLYFLTIPVVMIVLSLPGIFHGRSLGDVFTIYFNQTSSYKQMALNYPSFWTAIQQGAMNETGKYEQFSKIAVVLALVILLLYLLAWYKRKVSLNYDNLISMALLTVYTCVLFLPAMHERYGFLYEILALFVAFRYYKTIPMLVMTYVISLCAYSRFLFGSTEISLTVLSILNIAVYTAYAVYLNRQILKTTDTTGHEAVAARLTAR